jgi:hypothetical protein
MKFEKFSEEDPKDCKVESADVETEAVIQPCRTCSRPFRTYVPGTNCVMPDGTSFSYSEPQEECPCCDISQW